LKYTIIFVLLSLLPLTTQASTDISMPLAEDEGWAIIAIYSKGYAEKIELSGSGFGNNHTFGPLDYSQEFQIVKLKAGKYSWERVIKKVGENGRQKSDFSHLDLNFEITAGNLNYVGLFMYESNGSTFSAKILNRTSIILSILKQDFPQYLKKYDVVNGIYPSDRYIDFFLNNSKAILAGE